MKEIYLAGLIPRAVVLPAAKLGAAPLAFLWGGALRFLMSWNGSFGAGRLGVDSISKNLTNISENDCHKNKNQIVNM